MSNRNLTIEYLPLLTLKKWPRNPKEHDLPQLNKSIARFGYVNPIIINESSGEILAGHGRLDALLERKGKDEPCPDGCKQNGSDWLVPVIRGVELPTEEAEAYAIADNRIVEIGGYDESLLADVLKDLGDGAGTEGTGFSEKDIAELLARTGKAEVVDDPGAQIDKAEELREKWKVERGQVWEVGRHRVMCGDSVDTEDIAALMKGAKVTLLLTDPPYNVGYKYESYDDNKERSEYAKFCKEFWVIASDLSDGQAILTPGKQNLDIWAHIAEWRDVAIWTKRNGMSGGRVSHLTLWEPILFYGKFERSARANDIFEFNLWHQKDVDKSHTCPKPITLWQELVDLYTDKNDVLLDPFLGSGTTLVACEQTNRIGYGMEIEPKYVAVTLQRLADMGLEPKLVENDH